MKTLLLLLLSTSAYAFDWQGHRGARGIYPENTIGAMREALKYPVTTLELDVVISQDQLVVVSHEPWMNSAICSHPQQKRFRDREFNLFKMSYQEIQRWDCGSKSYSHFPDQVKVVVGKPLLSTLIRETETLLKELKREGVSYNVEIKSSPEDEKKEFQPDYKLFSDLVLKTLLENLPKDRVSIQSFDWRVLKYLHTKDPELKLVALRGEKYKAQDILKELGFTPFIFSPHFKLLTKEDVEFFHQKGVKVIPWTVNDVAQMRKLKEIGVDGIITDYPNFIAEVDGPECGVGFKLFENKCVRLPKHSHASDTFPGWNCDAGFVQRRSECVKLKIPAHATLSEDGKSWICKEGYERYRSICRKK